jgi:NAD+-dependent protein deacetylase sirtuin 4
LLQCYNDAVIDALVQLISQRRVVALTGAGCSTESGIPDYRGPGARPRKPIQHREFIDRADMRRRYWARSLVGWPNIDAAQPNPTHRALAALEHAGVVAGTITQNVDGLHQRAGSARIVELHGALARVRCLSCMAITSRAELQEQLRAANPRWGEGREHDRQNEAAPDGDAEVAEEFHTFEVVGCPCGGMLMPDVVFFGGSVPRDTLDAAWAMFDRAEVLLVVGSSLTVFSGYRFVRRAAERGVPVAIVNRGPTRGDPHAQLRVDALASEAMVALQRALT